MSYYLPGHATIVIIDGLKYLLPSSESNKYGLYIVQIFGFKAKQKVNVEE